MRRYGIVSGVLLILFIIDFALAAPVLVQEKRQASVDVVYMPRDVITMLGKRMDEDFNEFSRLVEGYYKTWKEPVEPSEAHGSSSPAPPGPEDGSTNVSPAPVPDPAPSDAHGTSGPAPPDTEDGSTNVVQAPGPDPASSDAHGSSSSAPPEPGDGSTNVVQAPVPDPASSDAHGSSSSASPGPDHGSTDVVQAPVPDGPDPMSSDAHAPSSSAPPRPDHGSTDVVQAPVPDGPDPISSDAHASSISAPPRPDHGSTDVVQVPVPDGPDPISSDTHASSISEPPRPDHESTNVAQSPATNPTLSTTHPNPLVAPSSPSSSIGLESEALSDSEDYGWLFEPENDDVIRTATSSGHGLDHELSSVPTGPDHGLTNVVQAPAPNPASSSVLSNSKNKWLFEPQDDHMIDFSQSSRNKRPWISLYPDPDPDPGFTLDFWNGYVNRPWPGSALPKEIGQTSEDQAGHVQAEPPDGPDPGMWKLGLNGRASTIHERRVADSARARDGDSIRVITKPNSARGSSSCSLCSAR